MSKARRPGWWGPALLVLFVALPILEVFLLVRVGQWIGLWPTLGLLVLSAALGTWLVRREGTKAWRALRDAVGGGRIPSRELTDGALVAAGGLLLILPGMVTDVVGLVCLLPFTRALPRKVLMSFADRQVEKVGLVGLSRGSDIEGEVVPEPTRPSNPQPGDNRAIEGRIID